MQQVVTVTTAEYVISSDMKNTTNVAKFVAQTELHNHATELNEVLVCPSCCTESPSHENHKHRWYKWEVAEKVSDVQVSGNSVTLNKCHANFSHNSDSLHH